MKSLRIIVLLLSSLSLYGMDDDRLASRIGSPARAASQNTSPFESPATKRANAELNGLADKDTPRRGALAKALAELAFKPTETERSCTHTIIGTSKDAPLQETEKAEKKRRCEDDSDSDEDEDRPQQPPQKKPKCDGKTQALPFMGSQRQNWGAKLAAAQQQQQRQIDISTLEELAQPQRQVAANSSVGTIQQEVAAQERLKRRKCANYGDSDSDDDEYAPEQPRQKKPKRDEMIFNK